MGKWRKALLAALLIVAADRAAAMGSRSFVTIAPTQFHSHGGEIFTIDGGYFTAPVRVFFDVGGGAPPKEAFVVSVTPNQVVGVTPPIDLGTGQTKIASVYYVNAAGKPYETRVNVTNSVIYRIELLTPEIIALSPNQGPLTGGSRVTIVGLGFEAPIQVFFDDVEAQIFYVNFYQVTVMSPPGRAIGAASLRVVNINSDKSTTVPNAYRYRPPFALGAVSPTSGPAIGGTRITVDGVGFSDPMVVTVAGVTAQVISLTGTRIIAYTGLDTFSNCQNHDGPIVVTNADDGEQAVGPSFTYQNARPFFTALPQKYNAGDTVEISVAKTMGYGVISIGDRTIYPIRERDDGNGAKTFTITIPTNLAFPSRDCGTGGVLQLPLRTTLSFVNLETGCAEKVAVSINPPRNADHCGASPVRRGGA